MNIIKISQSFIKDAEILHAKYTKDQIIELLKEVNDESIIKIKEWLLLIVIKSIIQYMPKMPHTYITIDEAELVGVVYEDLDSVIIKHDIIKSSLQTYVNRVVYNKMIDYFNNCYISPLKVNKDWSPRSKNNYVDTVQFEGYMAVDKIDYNKAISNTDYLYFTMSLVGKKYKKIIKEYISGKSWRELGKKYGKDSDKVRRLLRNNNMFKDKEE